MNTKTDHKLLDKVVKQTVMAMEKGRESLNEIVESARSERDELKLELELVKNQSEEAINKVDRLIAQEKQARQHLMEVSRNFAKYKEADIREAYERARTLQLNLGLMQEREKQLRLRRDYLNLSMKKQKDVLERSEDMFSRTGVALDYLIGNLHGLEAGLEEAQEKQGFGLRIILAQEEERKRVAREIHDGPAQSMASLVLRAEICEKLLNTNRDEVKEELKDLKTMVRNSLQEIRKIIFDLRPMALDDLGLIATLKRFLEDYRDKYGLKVDFVHKGNYVIKIKDMEIAIYRIIQEALNNVVKHAAASEVLIRIEIQDDSINLIVRDNGRGFDLTEKRPGGSYGIMGMNERIDLLEGNLTINTGPGKGTELVVNIPVKPAVDSRS